MPEEFWNAASMAMKDARMSVPTRRKHRALAFWKTTA